MLAERAPNLTNSAESVLYLLNSLLLKPSWTSTSRAGPPIHDWFAIHLTSVVLCFHLFIFCSGVPFLLVRTNAVYAFFRSPSLFCKFHMNFPLRNDDDLFVVRGGV